MLFCPPLQDMPIIKTPEGVILYVTVTPNAAKSRIGPIKTGQFHPVLKLFITEPAVEGKANRAVIDFFHKLFKHPKSAFTIQSGQLQRSKTVLITGLNVKDILKHII